MNKTYKVIYSKVKNCYVVVSELARRHTKAPASGTINRVIVAGILACVLSGGAVLPVYADVTYSSNSYMSQNLDSDFSNKTVDFFNAYPTYDSYQSELTVNYNSAYQAYRSSVNEVLVAVTNLKNDWDDDILCDAILNATSYSSFNDSINQLKLNYPTLYARYNIHPVDSFMVRQFAEAIGGTAITDDDIFLDNVVLDYSIALSTYENNLVLKNKLAKAFGQNSIAIGKSSVVNRNSLNSVAIGINSSVTGDNALALGANSLVSGSKSVVLGSESVGSEDNVISVGHKATDLNVSGTAYGTDLYRRIVNVADGIDAHDVVTKIQMEGALQDVIDNAVFGINDSIDNNLLEYAKKDASNISSNDDKWAEAIGTGAIEEGNRKLVTGSTVYSALTALNSNIDTALSNKADVKLNNIDSDGQSVVKSLARQSVQLEDGNHTAVAYRVDGNNYIYKVNVKDDGQVADGNTDLVTGGTVYNAIQNAMLGIDIPDDGAVSANSESLIKGKVIYNEVRPSDGNYVRQSNTTAQNLSALDTKVKNVEDVTTENLLNVGTAIEQQAGLIDGLRTDLNSVSSSVDTLQQNYDTLQGNVDNIQTSVNTLSGRMDTLETDVQGLTTRTASLEGNVSSIEGRTASLETGLSDVALRTGNLETTVNAMQGNVTTVTDSVSGLQNTINGIQNDVGNLNTNVSEMQNTVGNLETAMTGLETTVDGMQSDIDTLNTDVSGLKQDMSGVQATVTGLQTDVGTLQDDMTDVKSNVSGLQTDMNTVKEDVTGIHTEITGIKDNVNAVVSDVNDVKTTLGTVQSDVNEMKDDFAVMQSDIETAKNDVQSVQSDVAGVKEDVASVQSDITSLQQEKANADGSNIDVDKWLEKISQESDGFLTNETLMKEVRGSKNGVLVRKDATVGDNLLSLDDGISKLKEDIKKKTHGMSINSVDENDTNYDGEGATGDNAMAFGVNAEAQGEDSIAIGHGAKAHGKQSIAIGTGNKVTGNHSGAFGDPNDVTGDSSYVMGNNNTVSGNNSFVLSNDANVTGSNSVVLGNGSDGSMDNVVSVGSAGVERKIVYVANGDITPDSKDAVNGGQLYNVRKDLQEAKNIDKAKWAEALGTGEVAEGDDNLVTGGTVYNAIKNLDTAGGTVIPDMTNSEIHIGGNTMYDSIDVINISKSDGSTRVMTGVATNPNDPTSAANVGYVNAVRQSIVNGVQNEIRSEMHRVDDKMGKVGANAAAMASLATPPMDGDEKWAFSAAVGHYDGKTAGAVGAFYRPQDNVLINVRGAVGNGEDMIGAGVGISLERGNTPHVSKAQLVRTINAQAGKISEQEVKLNAQEGKLNEQNALIDAQNQRIAKLEAAMAKMIANQVEK